MTRTAFFLPAERLALSIIKIPFSKVGGEKVVCTFSICVRGYLRAARTRANRVLYVFLKGPEWPSALCCCEVLLLGEKNGCMVGNYDLADWKCRMQIGFI